MTGSCSSPTGTRRRTRNPLSGWGRPADPTSTGLLGPVSVDWGLEKVGTPSVANSTDSPVVRPVGLELATSWLAGRVETGPLPRTAQDARATLERVLLAAMCRNQTFVAFSGGRDSSAVLAAATHVARRAGLPDPVPVTTVYPELPGTDETEWQQMVLEHLGIAERVLVTVTSQEFLLGEPAQRSMRARGLLWPAAAQLQETLFRHVRGGLLLTGEGGDEVLGRHRITPLTLLLHLHRRPARSLLGEASMAILPRVMQGRIDMRRIRATRYAPWLTESARSIAVDQLARDSWEPLAWDRATWHLAGRRVADALTSNYSAIARDFDFTVLSPLLDRGFIAALANDGGRWGFAGRTDVMRWLFGDLLPDAILARKGKARFNGSRFGPYEREFARSWDGAGIDPALVDAARLREHWLTPEPSSASGLLMQAAWMYANGVPRNGRE